MFVAIVSQTRSHFTEAIYCFPCRQTHFFLVRFNFFLLLKCRYGLKSGKLNVLHALWAVWHHNYADTCPTLIVTFERDCCIRRVFCVDFKLWTCRSEIGRERRQGFKLSCAYRWSLMGERRPVRLLGLLGF